MASLSESTLRQAAAGLVSVAAGVVLTTATGGAALPLTLGMVGGVGSLAVGMFAAAVGLDRWLAGKERQQQQAAQGAILRAIREGRSAIQDIVDELHDQGIAEAMEGVTPDQLNIRLTALAELGEGLRKSTDDQAARIQSIEQWLERNGANLDGAVDTLHRFLTDHFNELTDLFESELRVLRSTSANLVEAVDQCGEMLRGRPNLLTYQAGLDLMGDSPPNGPERLRFRAEYVPFAGREHELGELARFLGDPGITGTPTFAWWLVLGPGGQGKSRLALELCRRHDEAWWAGFLWGDDDGSLTGWDAWQPHRPTLIVIDYVARRGKAVGQKLADLAKRKDSLAHPVRVLLLEREVVGAVDEDSRAATAHGLADWWRDLLGSSDRRNAIVGSCFRRTAQGHLAPMILPAHGENDHWATFERIVPADKFRCLNREQVLKQLTRIDPQGRPLYAALAASALADNRNLHEMDHLDLINFTLEKERVRWSSDSPHFDEHHQRLLALATMLGGVLRRVVHAGDGRNDHADQRKDERRELEQLGQADILPRPRSYNAAAYAHAIGRPVNDGYLPLEPDILGEAFVLDMFDRLCQNPAHKDTAEQLRDSAWRIDWFATGVFVLRCMRDLRGHRGFPFVSTPAGGDSIARSNASKLVPDLIIAYAKAGQPQDAQRVYDQLGALAMDHPDEPALRERQANAAINLVSAYGDAGKPHEAQRVYDQLVALAIAHPGESALRERQAKGAFNLVIVYGDAGKPQEARRIHDQLIALVLGHRYESALREQQAGAAVNVAVAAAVAGKKDILRHAYDSLRKLHNTYPHDPVVVEVWQRMLDLIEALPEGGEA